MGELQAARRCAYCLAQALFGKPRRCCWMNRPTPSISTQSLVAKFPPRLRGNAHHHFPHRHFLNSVCTHIADIDYETIITYTRLRRHGDGQDPGSLPAWNENAQREKRSLS